MIRELQARFVASANGFKSTINGMKNDIDGLARDTKKMTGGMGDSFKKGALGLQTNLNKASRGMVGFGESLGEASEKVGNVGMSLTKKITLPATIAVGAIGGLIAKLGWDRLKSIDEATAQLEGLGYSAKEQQAIIATVTTAIEGGMTTMGDGIMIAAGGLAAGVKEGKDLEKYIKLVGDASVGANRPVGEMAQIFNRVVGGGRLMTMELNMIEQGMPGFAKAMADSLGVTIEEFRGMVTEGEISSDQFLEVMDDFAGGMAEAFSGTMSGMVENVKAYVAIIGENLLSGVFEKSKESMAEFIKLISSPEVSKKAEEMGETLGIAFAKIVDGVKAVVSWFMQLDTKYQKMFLSVGTFLVVLGPFLLILSGIGSAISYVSIKLGGFIGFLAKAITPIKSLTASTGLAGRMFTVLSGTVGAVIGWITLFAGVIYMAYQKSEPFRKSVSNLGKSFKDLWNRLTDILSPLKIASGEFSFMKNVVVNVYDALKTLADVIFSVIGKALSYILNYVSFVVDGFVAMLSGVEDFIQGFKKLMSGDFKGALESFKSGIETTVKSVLGVWKDLFSNLWNATKNGFNNIIVPFGDGLGNMILKAGKWSTDLALKFLNGLGNVTVSFIKSVPKWAVALTKGLGAMLVTAGEFTLELALKFLNGLGDVTVSFIKAVPKWALAFANGLGEISVKVGIWLLKLPGQIVYGLGSVTIFIANELVKWTLAFVKGLGTITISVAKWAYNTLPEKVRKGLEKAVTVIIEKLVDWGKAFAKKTGEIATDVYNWALDLPGNIKKGFINAKDNFLEWFDDKRDELGPKLTNMKDDVVEWAKALPGNITKSLGNGAEVFKKWLREQHEENKEFYLGLPIKAGKWLIKHVKKIPEGLSKWNDAIVTFFNETGEKIRTKASEMWTNFSEGFLDKKDAIFTKLSEWNETIVTFFNEIGEKIKIKATEMWTDFYEGFLDKKDAVFTKLSEWNTTIVDFFNGIGDKIKDKSSDMWKKFSEGFLDKKDAITKKLDEWNTVIVDFFNDIPGTIKEKASTMWTNFYDGFIDKKDAILKGLGNWRDGIIEWFTGTEEDMEDGAETLSERFVNSIKDRKDKIIEGFTDWKDGIINWFTDLGEDKDGDVEDAGKGLLRKFADGLDDKEIKDDILASIGKFILMLPGYIIITAGVLFFAAGRELIRFIIKGVLWAYDDLKKTWDDIVSLFSESSDEILERLESNFLGRMMISISEWGYDSESEFTNIWADIGDVFTQNTRTTRERFETNWLGRMFLSIGEWGRKSSIEFTGIWADIKDVFTQEERTIRERFETNWLGKMFLAVFDWGVKFKNNWIDIWADTKRQFKDKGEEIRLWFANSWLGKMLTKFKNWKEDFKGENSTMWQSIKKKFVDKMEEIRVWFENSWLGKLLKKFKDFKKDFKGESATMWDSVKRKFNDKMGEIRKSFEGSFVGKLLESGRNLKDKFIDIMKDMWEGTKDKFNDIVDGAKALPGRIGKGISSMKSKASDGMKAVGNKLIIWARKPFNKVVRGINWITGKLNKDRVKIDEWKPDLYAKGTAKGGHGGGPAILGDGVGTNAGEELTMLPNGKAFMSASSPTLYPNLPKGTEVMSATDTRKFMGAVPEYAKGTRADDLKKAYSPNAKKKRTADTKKGLKMGNDSISDVWDFVKKPGTLVNKALKKFGANMKGGFDKFGHFGQMLRGGFGKVKDAGVQKVKDMFKSNEDKNPANIMSGSVFGGKMGGSSRNASAWRSVIKKASSSMNANASKREINGIIAQINRESGGNQNIVQSSAVWDVNTASGNPARGLLQYIPQTFNAYKTKGHGNIYSGYDQLRAFFNNSTWRRDLPYGTRGWGPRGSRRGYADGGIVNQKQLAWIAEGGWSESVISHDPNKKVAQRSIWEKTGDMLGFNESESTTKLLERITKLLEDEKDTDLLRRIAEEIENGHVIEANGEKIAELVNTKNAESQFGKVF